LKGKIRGKEMRSNLYQKVVLTLILGSLLGLLYFKARENLSPHQLRTNVIQAQRFELVDDKGKVWAKLGFENNITSGLLFFNAKGRAVAKISSPGPGYNGSATMTFLDKAGLPRMLISQSSAIVYGKDNHSSVQLAVYDNCPQIGFHDKEFCKRLTLSLQKDGSPEISLRDAKEKIKKELTIAP
jgi:hypothetical protein